MAHPRVKEAIRARLTENYKGSDVYYPNEKAALPRGSAAFVQVQFPVANVAQVDIAAKTYREEGTVRLVINMPRNFGTAKGDEVTFVLGNLFRGKRFGGIQTFSPSSPVEDDRNEDGTYYTVSISIPYHYVFRDVGNLYT